MNFDASISLHPSALCESDAVGRGSRIGAFSRVMEGAAVGSDCIIGDHVVVESGVRLGDRVTVDSGVHLRAPLHVESDVALGPNATFASGGLPWLDGPATGLVATMVRSGASVGANATILPNIEIGARSVVRAGSVVTRSVPPRAIVEGNPARIVGYLQADGQVPVVPSRAAAATSTQHSTSLSSVRGVALHRFPEFTDMRGSLSVGNFDDREVPFTPRRFFLVYAAPGTEVRGEHAHRACHQFLICTRGACSVVVDDGTNTEEFRLDSPALGLHLPPMTWGIQYKYTADAVLLVFASHAYDSADYIRDYPTFLAASRA